MSHVGIVVALAQEAKAWGAGQAMPGQIHPLSASSRLLLCGIGAQAAAEAARRLADDGAKALVVLGVAGGLNPQLRSGAVTCASRIVDGQGRVFHSDPRWSAKIPFQKVCFLSTPAALTLVSEKNTAFERSHADVVDMESAAVAAVAHKRKLPLLAIRAVADEAGDALPQAALDLVDRYGRPDPRRVLSQLLRAPHIVVRLVRLAAAMNKATRALEVARQKLGPELAWNP